MAKKKAKKKVSKKKKVARKKKKVAKKKSGGAKPPTKSEIMKYIAEDTELSKADVAAVFESLSVIMGKSLKGKAGIFNMPGLFKAKRINVKAKPKRFGTNPFTGEEQWFKAKPASKRVKLYPLKALKEMV